MVRTRIAPSPTGFPHIGTVYQALFDYAYAKKHGGRFIVRIEDTDRARFVEGAEEKIYSMLDWFGLNEDESPRKSGEYGPYRQSERLNMYKKYAEELVEKGAAYYCFCTKERLEALRREQSDKKIPPMYDRHCLGLNNAKERVEKGEPHVIRLKIPRDTTIVCKDEIRGDIQFEGKNIDDQVLIKADGFPTYHLAVVVDDHEMKITDIVRGEEWISSMPKHILLYKAFGWEIPKFYHTAVIRNPDKAKLSKRHGHASVDWYQKEGFLPEALLNFLALMGWSHPEEKEIFSLEEFIRVVALKDLRAVGPVFDMQKLEWINGEYIRAMGVGELKSRLVDYYGEKYSADLLDKTIPLIQERIKTLKEFDEYCDFFIQPPSSCEKDISKDKVIIEKMIKKLEQHEEWQAEPIGQAMQELAQSEQMSFGAFFMILRIALTGGKITPPLNESMEILGKEECLKRLSHSIQ